MYHTRRNYTFLGKYDKAPKYPHGYSCTLPVPSPHPFPPFLPCCSMQMFAWEAAHDFTLIILMACAAISLVAGMVTDVSSDGQANGLKVRSHCD